MTESKEGKNPVISSQEGSIDRKLLIFARTKSLTSITLFLIVLKEGKNPSISSIDGNIAKNEFIFVVTRFASSYAFDVIPENDGKKFKRSSIEGNDGILLKIKSLSAKNFSLMKLNEFLKKSNTLCVGGVDDPSTELSSPLPKVKNPLIHS